MASNNKLIYTYSHGARPVSPELLASYADSLIIDLDKKDIWYKAHQIGHSYYGSDFGESFNNYKKNTASGSYSFAEGSLTVASGVASHAAGIGTYAHGEASFSQGIHTYTDESANASHAEGVETSAYNEAAHAEGEHTQAHGIGSHTEGEQTITYGDYSHAEGYESETDAEYSHAEGLETKTYAPYSHAEGFNSVTSTYGIASHAEGSSISYGKYSHAEGDHALSYGDYSHAEGYHTISYGKSSHAEGYESVSYGNNSLAIGKSTQAIGSHSLAAGIYSYAGNTGSASIGSHTVSYNNSEFSIGKFNNSIEDSVNGTIFTIGDGTDHLHRHNIVEITKNEYKLANAAYYGNGIFGDVSYSYVNLFDPIIPLEELIYASLERPNYTKPTLYTKFVSDGTDISDYYASYEKSEDTVAYLTMEVGTLFRPGISILWPTTKQDREIGTRSAYSPTLDYATTDPKDLGYSYGIPTSDINDKPVIFKYASALDYDYVYDQPNAFTYAQHIGHVMSDNWSYLKTIGDYKIIDNISLSYLESSYTVFSRLWERGNIHFSYGYGDNTYFGKGEVNIPGTLYIKSRYPWYSGFGNAIPENWNEFTSEAFDMKKSYIMSLTINDVDECFHEVSKDDSKMSYFFFAKPIQYGLFPVDNMTFSVEQTNGLEFNLISDVQPYGRKLIEGPCGTDKSILYDLYYIKFTQSPLGIYGSKVKTHIVGLEPVPDDELLLTEYGWPIATEDGENIQYDNLSEPKPKDFYLMTDAWYTSMTKHLTDEDENLIHLG